MFWLFVLRSALGEMKKVEEYLAHAEQCRALGARGPAHLREQFQSVAQTWEHLAKVRREQIERQKRIAELELAAGWLRMTREQR